MKMSEELVVLREALEDTYNKLKNAMAYTQNDAVYTMLEEARKFLINAIQLINQAIDAEDAPFEVIEG
jgi:hypothetical protein